VATIALAGCTAPAEEPPTRDTLIVAVAGTPSAFAWDFQAGGNENYDYLALTGAGLIRNTVVESEQEGAFTQDLYSYEGVLAESYDVDESGTVFTFHLREDVVSVAGNPFTADDVIWSYERKWNSGITPGVSRPALVDPATQLVKIDDYTVEITVAQPAFGFPLLAGMSKVLGEIYDSTLLQEHATADDPYAVGWSNENGNYGYGPYIMTSFSAGEELTFEANPDYPLGEPAIENIVQRVVPEAANRAVLLQNGDVDAAVQLRPTDLAAMDDVDGVDTFSTPTNSFLWAFISTLNAPFDDPAVREALFYAVPYEQIMSEVYADRAEPVVGLLDPALPNSNDEGLLEQSYDPERSLEILEDAGYTEPVAFSVILNNTVPELEDVAVQIEAYAADAGFDVTIEALPPQSFVERNAARNFQVKLQREFPLVFEDPRYALMFAFPQGVETNRTGWNDPAYYAAVEAGVAAGDALSEEAGEYWHEAELIWQEGRPQIQIAQMYPFVGLRSDVTGFVQRADNVLDYGSLAFE
jgi:peptide/nickel transport system substrate-binding protein